MADDALPEIADDIGGELEPAEAAVASPNFLQSIMEDPQKRLYAIAGAAVLVILIVVFIVMGGQKDENRGKLVTLVQELNQSRAFEIVAKLKEVNIEAKIEPSDRPGQYVVQVYDKAVETAYLNLSRTNLLEDEGYGLFDETDWAASDYDKRIKLTRAINGDLSRIISRMDGLRSAIVRVNIPEQQLFTEFQTPTTATVQVELENETDELSKSQVRSIVNVMRGYVPNLEKDKVSIVDTLGNNYNTFKEEDESTADDFIEEIEKVNKTIKKRIEKYLDSVLGSEKYKVSVSASISRERVEKQQTTYSEGAVGQIQTGTEKLISGGGGNIAGPGATAGRSKAYDQETKSETLLPSFEQQNITYLPGRITKVSVALAVDQSVPALMSLTQLRESVAAIVGPEANAESIKLTVVDLVSDPAGVAPSLQKEGQKGMILGFIKPNSMGATIFNILAIIGTILGLLIVGILGLNFLGSAVEKQAARTVDERLGEDFEDVMNEGEDEEFDEDYGEKKAMSQQEALLKEMMNPQASPSTTANLNAEPQAAAATVARPAAQQENQQQVEFENLLNNFQTAAQNKPDILAKKIQVWLEDDEQEG